MCLLTPRPKLELGNPPGYHLLRFFKGHSTAVVGGVDPSIDGGQSSGIDLDLVRSNLQLEVFHTFSSRD